MKRYDNKNDIIELEEADKIRLKELRQNVVDAQNKLKDFETDVYNRYTHRQLGILEYQTKNRKSMWSCDMTVKKFTILAYRTWSYIDENGVLSPQYYHATEQGLGNNIGLYRLFEVEFVPLDNVTFEDAKKILKEVKKNKPKV